ncbi:MAG: Ig-like domain-containing protein, partial [candidate division Zixibacteria bacterium]|nr:Ig-like domain-containing protein [candidate division Zixibacteria bacterium]
MSLSKIKLVRIISILFLLLLFSCTKDESPAGPSNIPLQDNTPPSIVSIVPAHLAEDVALETTIILEFSEAIDTMIFDASFIVFTPSIDGTISIDSNMVTYTPSTDLLSNTTYSVSISDQTVDYAGNSMESVYSWEFTTELVIIVEPPSSLRGNYVGIYDLLA